MGRPSGRRHDAFLAYLDAVRNNEERWGLETMQVRAAEQGPAERGRGRHCRMSIAKAHACCCITPQVTAVFNSHLLPQARSGRRCTAAVYKAVHGGSQGVATCLEWSGHLGGGSELPPRPSTAPPSGSGSSSPSRFLDFYSVCNRLF